MLILLQDLRYSFRTLRRAPGFTAVAVLTLALGMGANTAIFSVVNGVLLRPLPYPDSGRLLLLGHEYAGQSHLKTGVSPAGFRFYREQNRVFQRTAAFTDWGPNFVGNDQPQRLVGEQVSSEYFTTLGVRLLVGRSFTPDEERPGANRVVVVAEGLWRRAFGADPGLVGRLILIDGEDYKVVGIAPFGFDVGRERVEIWRPLAFTEQQLQCWGCEFLQMIARLRDDATLAAARRDLDRIAAVVRGMPESLRGPGWKLWTNPVTEELLGDVRPPLLVLMGAVGFVLLIACANLANLLLARGTARQREIAIRTAMGAGRGRLARQLLTECLLLSLGGAGLGLLVAFGAVRGLLAMNPANLPRLQGIGLDGPVLLFTLVIAVIVGLLFGLAPAS